MKQTRAELQIMQNILDVQKERDGYRAELKTILSIPYDWRSKESNQRADRLTSCIISCNESIAFNRRELNTYR